MAKRRLRPPSPSVARMTRTILKVWEMATPEQRQAGLHWYDNARAFAVTLADEFGVSVEVAACVISAYSQNNGWGRNKAQAHAHLAGKPAGLGAAIRAARAAMAHPHDPFAYIVGPKLHPFARCVAGDLTQVATDRWAQRIAYGLLRAPTRGEAEAINALCDKLIERVGARADMIKAYEKAAAEVGVEPAIMQATVWIVIRGGGE